MRLDVAEYRSSRTFQRGDQLRDLQPDRVARLLHARYEQLQGHGEFEVLRKGVREAGREGEQGEKIVSSRATKPSTPPLHKHTRVELPPLPSLSLTHLPCALVLPLRRPLHPRVPQHRIQQSHKALPPPP